jgi:hypothetical protein
MTRSRRPSPGRAYRLSTSGTLTLRTASQPDPLGAQLTDLSTGGSPPTPPTCPMPAGPLIEPRLTAWRQARTDAGLRSHEATGA